MPSPVDSPDRMSALALGGGSLLMLFAMAHHPTGVAHAASLEAMSRGATLSAWVHGTLIASMLVVLWGFLALAQSLGWRSRRTRIGLVAYAFGTTFLVGAALVSGFVAPRLALGGALQGGSEALGPGLRLLWETNQALAQAGTVALSAALVAWSAVLLFRGTWARVLGVAGLAIGLGTPAFLMAGGLHLDVRGMGAVLVAQVAWNVGVAAWLFAGADAQAGQSQAKTAPVASP